MRKHHVLTSLKHFPGHGSSKGDTHQGFVDVSQTWKRQELEPFWNRKADSVMIAHVVCAPITGAGIPASLSSRALRTLRKGNPHVVAITDDLQMGAIRKHYSLKETIRRAILAGNDILLFGNQLSRKNKVRTQKLVTIVRDLIASGQIKERVIRPTLDGMKAEGAPFEGVLFIGLMIVDGEPLTLEFNVRFGDPECEILMPLMKSPASELFYKAATKQLDSLSVEFSDQYAVGVVMASRNYPYSSSEPAEIVVDKVVHDDIADNTHISYAGVSMEDGRLFATGGRVLVCVGLGSSIEEARRRAYMLCGQVHFAGKKLRTDIAYQAL
jgi:phosphoribosylamine--glycine ligase